MIDTSRVKRFLRIRDRTTRSFLKNEKGFTLLEVLIAMAIMVLAFASILAVESGSISATSRAQRMNIVGMLAKNQMVETELKLRRKKFNEVKLEEKGSFESPYQDYRWHTSIRELPFPSLGSPGGEEAGEMETLISTKMAEYLKGAARELTVVVCWKQSNKEQSFSLTTYWIDFAHEIKI